MLKLFIFIEHIIRKDHPISNIVLKKYFWLRPTGAQEVLIFVCPSVQSFSSSLSRAVNLHLFRSVSTQIAKYCYFREKREIHRGRISIYFLLHKVNILHWLISWTMNIDLVVFIMQIRHNNYFKFHQTLFIRSHF